MLLPQHEECEILLTKRSGPMGHVGVGRLLLSRAGPNRKLPFHVDFT